MRGRPRNARQAARLATLPRGRRGSRPSKRRKQPTAAAAKQHRAQRARLQNSRFAASTDFDLSAEVCPRRSGNQKALPGLGRCAQHCKRRISCGFWRGFHAKITGGFSDDGALRTTRAGLVSASGRSRRASAEKRPVGFGAAKILKKSSRLNQRRAGNREPKSNSPACRATAQCAAGRAMRGRPRGLPRCRVDGVEAVPPKDGSSQQPQQPNSTGLNDPGYRTANSRNSRQCKGSDCGRGR